MALNTKFRWSTASTTPSGYFDVETVMLHENGHVLGLGHSDKALAVMFANYQNQRRELHADDISGASFLYPLDGATGSISGTVIDGDGGPGILGARVQVVGTRFEANTVADGSYTISGIPEETYPVTATASGFSTETFPDVPGFW